MRHYGDNTLKWQAYRERLEASPLNSVESDADDYPNLQDILTRPINWELIRQQYDEMVKFTTGFSVPQF